MNDLNDEHLDAFFHAGDAGTYEGGHAHAASLSPLAVDALDGTESEAIRAPSPEQLERRERYKRLVTRFVGTLGALALLGGIVRMTRSHGVEDATVTPPLTTPERAAPVAAAVAPVVEKREEAVPSTVLALAVAPPTDPVPVEHPEAPAANTVAPAPAQKKITDVAPAPRPVARAASPSVASHAEHSSKAAAKEEPSKAEPVVAALRPAIVTVAPMAKKTDHVPPTATFAN